MGWSFPIDSFALGCILFELRVGKLLFPKVNLLEHLQAMEAVMGPMPSDFLTAAKCVTQRIYSLLLTLDPGKWIPTL